MACLVPMTRDREQIATILMRYDQGARQRPSTQRPSLLPNSDEDTDVLIAYFSCTGNAEAITNHLNSILDADFYEIVPRGPTLPKTWTT